MCPKLLGLCSVSEANGSKDMGIDIAALDTVGRDKLLERWRSLIGRPPPKHISRALLIQIIAFELQSKHHSGSSAIAAPEPTANSKAAAQRNM